MNNWNTIYNWGLVLFLALLLQGHAQEVALPSSTHFPILLKALSFDRNLKQRSPSMITLGVVYQSKFRASLNVANEIQHYFTNNDVKISSISIKIQLIDLVNEDLTSSITAAKCSMLYIAPLKAFDISSIHAYCVSQKIITMTGVPEYVENHSISLGVGTRDGNPEIIINRNSCLSENIDFSAQLLKLKLTRIIE